MNKQQLGSLLTVTQINDYTWRAVLPEITMMWSNGHSEDEARENWLGEYDQPALSAIFASILQERAEHPSSTSRDDTESKKIVQRPMTVDFPYRGRMYRFSTNEGLPKRYIVLPNGTVLVVCRWTGRIPSALADVRRSPVPMLPETIAQTIDGVLAEEIPLLPGQTAKAMAILDFEGQRYAIDHDSHALIEFPDGSLYRTGAYYPEEPERIAEITPFDPNDPGMTHVLKTFGKTPAIPVDLDYPGMAHAPRDLRIKFSIQGERFIVSHEAYEQHKWIVFVPGYGYYRIGIYLESSPVKLGELSPLPADEIDPRGVAAALHLADAVDVER